MYKDILDDVKDILEDMKLERVLVKDLGLGKGGSSNSRFGPGNKVYEALGEREPELNVVVLVSILIKIKEKTNGSPCLFSHNMK